MPLCIPPTLPYLSSSCNALKHSIADDEVYARSYNDRTTVQLPEIKKAQGANETTDQGEVNAQGSLQLGCIPSLRALKCLKAGLVVYGHRFSLLAFFAFTSDINLGRLSCAFLASHLGQWEIGVRRDRSRSLVSSSTLCLELLSQLGPL